MNRYNVWRNVLITWMCAMIAWGAIGACNLVKPTPNDPLAQPTPIPGVTPLPSPSVTGDSLHPWGVPSKSTGCAYDTSQTDALPDMACTPGAVNPDVNQNNIQQTICVKGWASKERAAKFPESVSGPDKLKSMRAYGQSGSPANFEYDHKVAIEDGGNPSDAAANLWPQPIAQARQKDALENYLHEQICAGRMQLRDGQNMIATNWYAAYQQLISTGRLAPGSPDPSTTEDSGV